MLDLADFLNYLPQNRLVDTIKFSNHIIPGFELSFDPEKSYQLFKERYRGSVIAQSCHKGTNKFLLHL